MVEKLYGLHVLISQLTNRPLLDGQKEQKVPTFHCTLCNTRLYSPVVAIQHFWKGHSSVNKKFSNQKSFNTNTSTSNIHHQASKPKQARLECVPCNMTFTSAISQQHHLTGRKHALNANKASVPITHDTELICQICDSMFNSPVSAQQHFSGKKHAMNVAASNSTENISSAAMGDNNEIEKLSDKIEKIKSFSCNVCNIHLTSSTQLQQHCAGVRHKLATGAMKKPPDWWKEQQGHLQKSKETNKTHKKIPGGETFRCDTCNITLNSQVQLSQHLASSKHTEMATQGNKGGRGAGRGGAARGNASRGGVGRGSRGGGSSRGSSGPGGNGRGVSGRGRGGAKRPGPGIDDSTMGNKRPRPDIFDRGFSVNQDPSHYDKPWGVDIGNGSGKITDRLQNLAGLDQNRGNQANMNQQQNQQQFYTNSQSQNTGGYMSFF